MSVLGLRHWGAGLPKCTPARQMAFPAVKLLILCVVSDLPSCFPGGGGVVGWLE